MSSKRPQPLEPFRDERDTQGDPYSLLEAVGVSANSSAKDVHRAGMRAQARGLLDADRTKAWADLRNAGVRVTLDLGFMYPGGFDSRHPLYEMDSVDLSPPPLEFPEVPPPPLAALMDLVEVPELAQKPTPPLTPPTRPLPPLDVDRFALAEELLECAEQPGKQLPACPSFLTDEDEV